MSKTIITKHVGFYSVTVYSDGTIWVSNWRNGHAVVVKGDTRRSPYRFYHAVHKHEVEHFIKKCIAHGVAPSPVVLSLARDEVPCAMFDNTARRWF